MKTAKTWTRTVTEILQRKEGEPVQGLRKRDDITIEKSADPMDGIQCAAERDLAIGNLDLESNLLRQVRAALRRMHDRCIHCEGVADLDREDRTKSISEVLANAA